MKTILALAFGVFGFSAIAKSQTISQDTTRVILENSKLKVTEYVSTAGKDVCGKGKHYHGAHLSILLTDAKVQVINADGKAQLFELPAGTTFWSEPETHVAINNGTKTVRAYIVELK